MSLPARAERVSLGWPRAADEPTHDAVHRLVAAVTRLGGAVGWEHEPSRGQVARWLDGVLTHVAAGRSRLVLAQLDGVVEAMGYWARYEAEVLRHNAEVRKVMTHPDARGQGLGHVVVAALVDDARAHGVETLVLDVRGNNRAAMSVYEAAGFEVWGRLPDFVAVGEERFDRVSYRLDLGRPAHVRRVGGRAEGPGASGFRSLSTRRRQA